MPDLAETIADILDELPDIDLPDGSWVSPVRLVDADELAEEIGPGDYTDDELRDMVLAAVDDAVAEAVAEAEREAEREAARDAEREAARDAKWLERLLSGDLAKERQVILADDRSRRTREWAARADHRDRVVAEEIAAGATVTHISDRASVYLRRPDGTRIRVSDHLLPETDARRWSREAGNPTAWDEDLTLD
jgi:hypothetical protein